MFVVEENGINDEHINFVITAVPVLWDMMPWSLVERYCFRLTCCFQFQGGRVNFMRECGHRYRERRRGYGGYKWVSVKGGHYNYWHALLP
jgi:hypothetical protein